MNGTERYSNWRTKDLGVGYRGAAQVSVASLLIGSTLSAAVMSGKPWKEHAKASEAKETPKGRTGASFTVMLTLKFSFVARKGGVKVVMSKQSGTHMDEHLLWVVHRPVFVQKPQPGRTSPVEGTGEAAQTDEQIEVVKPGHRTKLTVSVFGANIVLPSLVHIVRLVGVESIKVGAGQEMAVLVVVRPFVRIPLKSHLTAVPGRKGPPFTLIGSPDEANADDG